MILWHVLVTACARDLSASHQCSHFQLMKGMRKHAFYLLLNFSLQIFLLFFKLKLRILLCRVYRFKRRKVQKVVIFDIRYSQSFA